MRGRMIGIIGLMGVVAACGSAPPVQETGAEPTTTTQSSPGESAPAQTTTGSSTGGTAPAEPATSEAAAATDCTSEELSLSVGDSEGAAGTVYREIVFTNKGTRTCTMQGFPGVSYVAGDDGHQVGPAAYRDGAKGAPVTLKPGGTAVAPVGFVNVRNYDPAVCKPTKVRGLRVFPPQETESLFLELAGLGCAGNPPGNQLVVKTIVKS